MQELSEWLSDNLSSFEVLKCQARLAVGQDVNRNRAVPSI
jgi:hypothetical protein